MSNTNFYVIKIIFTYFIYFSYIEMKINLSVWSIYVAKWPFNEHTYIYFWQGIKYSYEPQNNENGFNAVNLDLLQINCIYPTL